MKSISFLIVASSLSVLASAQTMYKCGSTFSQVPCGKDAEVIAAAGVQQPSVDTTSAETIERLKDDCKGWVSRVPSWKDSESLRFSGIKRIALETRTINGVARTVRPYGGFVNAKNSYGAYGGEKVFMCYADKDETKILDVYLPVF